MYFWDVTQCIYWVVTDVSGDVGPTKPIGCPKTSANIYHFTLRQHLKGRKICRGLFLKASPDRNYVQTRDRVMIMKKLELEFRSDRLKAELFL